MKDLHEILLQTKENFKKNYKSEDFILTEEFKDKYAAYLRNNGQNVEFNDTTAIIKTSGNLSIYAPNQWFAIAAYVVEFLQELFVYKKNVEDILAEKKYSSKEKKEYITKMKENTTDDDKNELVIMAERYFDDFNLTQDEKRLNIEYITKFLTDYTWWSGNKTIDRGDYFVSPVLSLLGLVNASQSYVAEIANILAIVPDLADISSKCIYRSFTSSSNITGIDTQQNLDSERKTGGQNLIVYGAPGTGKSRGLEDLLKSGIWENKQYDNFISNYKRVVFHPEYTYFDFIGTYKPIPIHKETSEKFFNMIERKENNLEPYIDYKFVPGPFITVLVESWLDKSHMHTLLIEEINRANAAFVFGEIFQLLDRLKDGTSEYAYEPSKELMAYMLSIKGLEEHVHDGIKIPSNMNIVATMNSADQGVNILDSAFKRRWNYKYKKIDIGNAIHRDKLFIYANQSIKWGNFVKSLNDKLIKSRIEEDRLIGPYFIKPDELDSVSAMDKLLLYLWDDVLRHQRQQFFANNIRTFADLSYGFDKEDVLDLVTYLSIEDEISEYIEEIDVIDEIESDEQEQDV